MTKRVFIVHKWEGHPHEGWFPWLKKELEQRGFVVTVPQLPHEDNPRIHDWIPALTKVVGDVDEHTFFVGHSLGCQAIVRLLASLPENQMAGGAVFVAGFFKRLAGLEDDPEVQATDRHWLETPVDLKNAAGHMKKSIAIFSDNDPWVPLDNQDDFRDTLGSTVRILPQRGHFNQDDDHTFELMEARDALLEIAGGQS